jgi:membrane protease YdiL (CAAX protease family)
LVAGILAGVLLVVGIVGGVAVAGWGSFAEAPVDRSAGVLAITLLLGAVGEELLFRGYAFQYLERYWAWPTLLGSGLLFGLAHLSNRNVHWLAAANTALWGCLLGYAYVRTRRLWLPVGLHYGWNLALALSTSNMSGLTIGATAWTLRWSAGELWSGGAYGLEGGLFATLAAIPAFWFVRRMR